MAFGGSDAARFQAYQTRARMGAALWSRIILWTILGWFALTIWVVWHETGSYFPQVGHQYFWRWVICSTLLRIPFIDTIALRCTVPANGAWYLLGPLVNWMNGPKMYYQPFPTWFWHYGVRTALIPVGLGVAAIIWRIRHHVGAFHVRGLKLLTARAHDRQLNGGIIRKVFSRRDRIQIGDSTIPAEKMTEHILISGSPGSGKSCLVRQLLRAIRDRGETAIVFDVEGEFTAEFLDTSHGDIVLSPTDKRMRYWDPWLELRPETFAIDAEAMAASLVRGMPKTATEQFFQDSARGLIEAILEKAPDRNHPSSITEFLGLPRAELHRRLEGTRAYPTLDPGAADQGTGIISVAANAVKAFHYLPTHEEAGHQEWSARAWDRRQWIFLPGTEDTRDAVCRLQGTWIDCLVRNLLTAPIMSGEQIYIVADEFPALEVQPNIIKALVRGRKRGICCVIAFQNVSQLRTLYQTDGAITITSAPSTKILMRCDEPATAKWASDLLGAHEIDRLQMTQLSGLSSMREGVNLSEQRSIETLILPAEIQRLAPFEGFLAVAGYDRRKIKVPRLFLERNAESFIPRSRSAA
jgi:type IV secretory pathway TraG/TraD family ATPase VirD4